MKRNILIDCDPGHDDIMAILCAMAHPEELNVLGYTTVCGNNTLPSVTHNLLNVLSYIKHPAPVAMGCENPLIGVPEVQDAHGKTGLDGFDFPEPNIETLKISAVEFMKEQILNCADKVTLVGMGPLTNIAVLIKAYPETKKRIDKIVFMGGAIQGGNILEHSEFNIYADPFAAEIVAESGIPLVICPLEVCREVAISEEQILSLKDGGHISNMAYGLLDFYFGYARRHQMKETPVFDLCTILYLLYPDDFSGYACSLEVIPQGRTVRGMTVIEPQEDSCITVLTHAVKGLISGLLEDIHTLDEKMGQL